MNLLWAPPRIPRGLCYWFIVTLRRAPSTLMHAPGRGSEGGDVRKLSSSPPPPAGDIHPSSLSPCTLNFCEKCILNLNHADAAWIMIPRFSNCYSFDRWGFRYKYNRDYKVSNSLRILVIFHPHLRTIRRGLRTEACPRQRTVSNKRKKEKRRFFTFTRDKYVSTSRGVESVSAETYLRNPVVH